MLERDDVDRGDILPADTTDDRADTDDQAEPTLPEPVRARVIALVAAALGGMPADEVPPPLRRVAQFAPNRRARMGAPAIAAQLRADLVFRQRVADRVLDAAGDLGAAVREGTVPGAADPVEVAALTYLARPTGWRETLGQLTERLRTDAENAAVAERLRAAEHQVLRAEHERAVAKVEAEKLRDELSRLRTEADALREQVRSLTRALREAKAAEKRANELLATERGRAARAASEAEAEIRRLRSRLIEAELAASGSRAAAKEARAVDDARLWLLLETIGQAAVGLRRELALEPATILPADHVAATMAQPAWTSCSPCRACTSSWTATTSPSAASGTSRWSSSAPGWSPRWPASRRRAGPRPPWFSTGPRRSTRCRASRVGCACCSAARARPPTS
jgi:hypothetical protein